VCRVCSANANAVLWRTVPATSPASRNEDKTLWDPVTEMKTLLDAILAIQPKKLLEASNEGMVASDMGKRGTNGLAAVVSKCLK
jgi:hypothetical protein